MANAVVNCVYEFSLFQQIPQQMHDSFLTGKSVFGIHVVGTVRRHETDERWITGAFKRVALGV